MRERRAWAEAPAVLVGVDGSAGSVAAVDLGAWEAKRHRFPLLLVHADPELTPGARDGVRRMLLDLELRARADHAALTVRSTLVAGGGASALVELSRGASLVVVGARGLGGFDELSLGSVAAQVVTHAHAPVIVARPPSDMDKAPARVVVGLDGSPESTAALGFAFDEASARAVPLVALCAVPPDEALAVWSDKYADVTVNAVVEPTSHPALALIEASRDADLVVVGHRGRGGFAGMLLGSVSRAVVTLAHSPVAVVREIEE